YKDRNFARYEQFLKDYPSANARILHPASLMSFFKGVPEMVEARKKDTTDASAELLDVDFIQFEIKEVAVYERARISRIVSTTLDGDLAKKYKIVGDFVKNFH